MIHLFSIYWLQSNAMENKCYSMFIMSHAQPILDQSFDAGKVRLLAIGRIQQQIDNIKVLAGCCI